MWGSWQTSMRIRARVSIGLSEDSCHGLYLPPRARVNAPGLQVFALVSLEYKLDCLYHPAPMRKVPTTRFVLVGDMIRSRAIRERSKMAQRVEAQPRLVNRRWRDAW